MGHRIRREENVTSFTLHTLPLGLWSLGEDLAPPNTGDVTLESFAERGVRKVFFFSP